MRLLLALPEVVRPGVAIHVVGAGGIEQPDAAGPDQGARVDAREIDY
jgi:hypothetical protein